MISLTDDIDHVFECYNTFGWTPVCMIQRKDTRGWRHSSCWIKQLPHAKEMGVGPLQLVPRWIASIQKASLCHLKWTDTPSCVIVDRYIPRINQNKIILELEMSIPDPSNIHACDWPRTKKQENIQCRACKDMTQNPPLQVDSTFLLHHQWGRLLNSHCKSFRVPVQIGESGWTTKQLPSPPPSAFMARRFNLIPLWVDGYEPSWNENMSTRQTTESLKQAGNVNSGESLKHVASEYHNCRFTDWTWMECRRDGRSSVRFSPRCKGTLKLFRVTIQYPIPHWWWSRTGMS